MNGFGHNLDTIRGPMVCPKNFIRKLEKFYEVFAERPEDRCILATPWAKRKINRPVAKLPLVFCLPACYRVHSGNEATQMETTTMTRMIENHYLMLQEDFLQDELAIVECAIRSGGHGVELLALDQRRRDIQQALHIRTMENYANGLQEVLERLDREQIPHKPTV